MVFNGFLEYNYYKMVNGIFETVFLRKNYERL